MRRASLDGARVVSAGSFHSVVVEQDGTVATVGSNAYGALGRTVGTPTRPFTNVVAAVPDVAHIVASSTGNNHTLLLRDDGTVWAFGDNALGALGRPRDGASVQQTPTQVLFLTCVVAIAAGGFHSLALRSDGTVWSFGRNDHGQLGRPSTGNPRQGTLAYDTVATQIEGLDDVVGIAAGALHSLAVRADGSVWTFGSNTIGQLGWSRPSRSEDLNPVPQPVAGIRDATAVAAGASASYALRANGTVIAFGSNLYGQLGSQLNSGTATPTPPIVVVGLSRVIALDGGEAHAVVLRADGTVWTFGFNETGQLGHAIPVNGVPALSKSPNPTPMQVDELHDVIAVSAGYGHTLAIEGDGTVWGFGQNIFGQIGRGLSVPPIETAVPYLVGG
jgi:alpha-tubulin suppressor-like RCC1 family protein